MPGRRELTIPGISRQQLEEKITVIANDGSIVELKGLFDTFVHIKDTLLAFACQPRNEGEHVEELLEAEAHRYFKLAEIVAEAVAGLPIVRSTTDREYCAEIVTRWAFECGENEQVALRKLAMVVATQVEERGAAA